MLEAALKIGSDNEFTCESHKESARTPDSSTEAGAPRLSLIKDELEEYSNASEDPESLKNIDEIYSEPNGAFIVMDYKRAPSECQVYVSSTKFIEKPSECISTVDAEEQIGVEKESSISDEFEDSLLKGVLVEAKIIFNELSEEILQQLRYEERNEKEYVSSPYKCETCIIVFPNSRLFEIHNRRKHSRAIGPHVCDVCAARFPEENKLRAHRAEHYKRHTCALCGFSRHSRTVVQRHYTVEHDTDRVLPCAKCNQVFSTNKSLQDHRKRAHYKRRKLLNSTRLKCERCGERFARAPLLRMHCQREHANMQPFQCKLCDKVECLNRRLKCKECDKRFARAPLLRIHRQREHANMQPFQCKLCDKSKTVLRAHTRRHLDERWIACLVHPATFNSNAALCTRDRPELNTTADAISWQLRCYDQAFNCLAEHNLGPLKIDQGYSQALDLAYPCFYEWLYLLHFGSFDDFFLRLILKNT